MSFWIRRKDAEGRTHMIASGAWWFVLIVPLIGILVAILLPLVQACRH
jgi:hypothetical protein